ncbi:MAG TPA: YbjN domain-containing protein [Micavibrio sp.]
MTELDLIDDVSNPLDSVEEVLHSNEWTFNRPNESEIVVQASGQRSHYRMTFLWQEEFSAMQFFCEMDETIPAPRMEMAARLLKSINERLWMGHFDIPDDTRTPVFRYTCLFRGSQSSGMEHVEDIVDIGLAECERFQHAFAMLVTAEKMTAETIELMLSEHGGAA